MYLSTATRPDIMKSTVYLSQFTTAYINNHWTAVKRILRYLKGTIDICLTYKNYNDGLVGYADADWGSDITDRKSFTDYAFIFVMLRFHGNLKSRKQ